MYIIALIILSLMAIVAVLYPYYSAEAETTPEDPGLDVYKAQLAELKAEEKTGLIGKQEAARSRIEIERRLLKAADHSSANVKFSPANNILAVALVVFILFSAGFYMVVGSPGMPDFPKSRVEQQEIPAQQAEAIENTNDLIRQVKERLNQDPNDARGYAYIAKLEMSLGNFHKASEALYQAHILEPLSFDYKLMYGESLIMATSERVTPAAQVILNQAKLLEPNHPGPKYYLALADFQAGDVEVAYAEWQKVRASLEDENPLIPLVDQWIGRAEQTLGLASSLPETRAPSINQQQAEIIQNMSAEEQQELIRQMVSQLAEKQAQNPTNIEGWIRLSRAYMVLGERNNALKAMTSAMENAPEAQKAALQKEVEKLTNIE